MINKGTIVVTGASSGIGKHISEKAQEDGYKVLGISRKCISSSFESISCDVTDANQVKDFFKQLRGEREFIGLVNCAGVASMNLFMSTPFEKMSEIFNINVLGSMYCAQQALKLFARRKSDIHSSIINFSTIAVPLSLKGEVIYVASKGAIESFSRSLARETSDFNCNVNVIAPGPIDTKLISKISPKKIDKIIERQIIQKKATKDDVWDVCSFLLSEKSATVTGQVFNLQGV